METIKRYLISSAVTFVTVFIVTLGAMIQVTEINADTLQWTTIVALVIAAARGAVKSTFEGLVKMLSK
jgi:hypothetical protein